MCGCLADKASIHKATTGTSVNSGRTYRSLTKKSNVVYQTATAENQKPEQPEIQTNLRLLFLGAFCTRQNLSAFQASSTRTKDNEGALRRGDLRPGAV